MKRKRHSPEEIIRKLREVEQRASAITMMIVVEEERACRHILESGIVNYKAASELIQNFPAPNSNSSSGHIAFRRHFFDDNLLQQCRRQYEICAVLVVVATLLVGVAVIAISRVRVAPPGDNVA